MTQLNIYVDETGDFGFSKNSSLLYGVAFVLHEQKNNINNEIKVFKDKLLTLNYDSMIHTAELVKNRDEYRNYSLKDRRIIFNILYQFTRRAKINYFIIFVKKNYKNSKLQLKKDLEYELNRKINSYLNYFQKFDKIVLYYDNGQEYLGKIIDKIFSQFNNYKHIVEFDHKEKVLFQVADMLTYLYKIELNSKKYDDTFFITEEELRKTIKELNNKLMH